MNPKIRTNISIIPFGKICYTSRGGALTPSKTRPELPEYQLPRTTDTDSLEFSIGDHIALDIPYLTEIEP